MKNIGKPMKTYFLKKTVPILLPCSSEVEMRATSDQRTERRNQAMDAVLHPGAKWNFPFII